MMAHEQRNEPFRLSKLHTGCSHLMFKAALEADLMLFKEISQFVSSYWQDSDPATDAILPEQNNTKMTKMTWTAGRFPIFQ